MQYLNSAYFRETQWRTCMFVLQIEQGFQLQILCKKMVFLRDGWTVFHDICAILVQE